MAESVSVGLDGYLSIPQTVLFRRVGTLKARQGRFLINDVILSVIGASEQLILM